MHGAECIAPVKAIAEEDRALSRGHRLHLLFRKFCCSCRTNAVLSSWTDLAWLVVSKGHYGTTYAYKHCSSMSEEKQPFRSPMVQIAVSRTPIDNVDPDRSLLKVFPKWLKVSKLWFQREHPVLTVT